jgi:hypothetical protein
MERRRWPHPFFWPVIGIIAIAVLAALSTEAQEPAFALNSALVYRLQIAGAVVIAGYSAIVLLWLAWHGLTLRRVELPGGVAVETPQANLDQAAADIEVTMAKATQRLDAHNDSIAELDDRLAWLEQSAG